MHLLQSIGHLFERFAQALLQRGVQFFVHGHAHFFEFFGVVLLDAGQTLFDVFTHVVHAPLGGVVELLQLLHQLRGGLRELLEQGFARVLRLGALVFAHGFELITHQTLHTKQVLPQFLALLARQHTGVFAHGGGLLGAVFVRFVKTFVEVLCQLAQLLLRVLLQQFLFQLLRTLLPRSGEYEQ